MKRYIWLSAIGETYTCYLQDRRKNKCYVKFLRLLYKAITRSFLLEERSKGNWALKGHLSAQGTQALEHLKLLGTQRAPGQSRNMATWALEYFRQLNRTWALRYSRHSEHSKLLVSFFLLCSFLLWHFFYLYSKHFLRWRSKFIHKYTLHILSILLLKLFSRSQLKN